MHMETLEYRREKLLKKLNVCQSVCEFYSFGYPPDYILYIGECLGEACGFIKHRTGEPHLIVSREQRWEEVRAMFRVHRIILDLMEVDPHAIQEH